MPKEAFYTWSGGLPHRKIFELRWAKETDVDPAKTVVYLPPLPAETPDGVFEMIGNCGDVTEIDRLIAALKRAKRTMLGDNTSSKAKFNPGQHVVALRNGWAQGESSGQVVEGKIYKISQVAYRASEDVHRYRVDGEIGYFAEDLFRAAVPVKPWNEMVAEVAGLAPNLASEGSGAAPGKYEDEVSWEAKDRLQADVADEIEIERLKGLKDLPRKTVEDRIAQRLFEAGGTEAASSAYIAANVFFELVRGDTLD
jgi:hypothetical protein